MKWFRFYWLLFTHGTFTQPIHRVQCHIVNCEEAGTRTHILICKTCRRILWEG